MIEKLKGLKERYDALTARMAEPDTMQDMDAYRALTKEHASLAEIVSAYMEYNRIETEIAGCKHMLSDAVDQEMKDLVWEELNGLEEQLSQQDEALRVLLLPKDPNDDKDVILEIRAGTGGEEASLFGADLLRMYERYAERNGYKIEFITSNLTDMNGVKEVVLSLSGRRGAYSRLKFESGVHRVQRVPATESQGRIHTSAATVAVLPEVDDVQVEIRDQDIRIDTYRSSGAGGQHVNKTESAIRITHLPTGIVVQCQDEKSQIKNKEQAMRVLKSRLFEHYQSIQDEALASERRSLVGSGDRSQRIRTYNFPQGRVTDHRIGLTLYKLEQFLDGDMDELIDALILAERAKMLSGENE